MKTRIYMAVAGYLGLLMVAGCSLSDAESADSHAEVGPEAASGKADGPAEGPAQPQLCDERADCARVSNARHWCSPVGECRYACERGWGDANRALSQDGCECRLSSGGREICNGVDDDCDGVVDNAFVGGRVSAAADRTCAVDSRGAIRCWAGDGEAIVHEVDARFWEVRVGSKHACALTEQGRAYCWGDNAYGQLGGEVDARSPHPTPVSGEYRFVDIAVGAAHSCGLTYDGEVHCWGRNEHGQLGDGSDEDADRPARVRLRSHDFVDVAAGDSHTCAATASGLVMCWGANHSGQAGQGEVEYLRSPESVAVPEALIFLEAGARHICGITGAGRAYCWGDNGAGQLGDETHPSTHEPRLVDADADFLALSAGDSHTCGIGSQGRLNCWGDNHGGQLGVDGVDRALRPAPVRSALAFSDLAAGASHSCAVSRAGHLYCWGTHSPLLGGELQRLGCPAASGRER